jgi:putative addiction module component (TIGR02574 family)
MMSNKLEALREQARQLSPQERITLVEDLLESLDATDPAMDRLWAREARDRIEAYRRGELTAIELKDVIAKFLP